MPKVEVKDVIMFLKIFGVSSLFFIAGIIICFIGPTKLGIGWPAYVIIGAMLNGFGVVVLIIETIRFIKTHNKQQKQDSIEDVIKKEDTK
ncbi:MAG: hypothetical protein EIB84_03190 [Spiroplasma poulsonii]|uniref:Uncharacterized protein n=1 Tax=Spiroplasma poulsonii TaxID=2138 RepID=A0A0C2HSQ3_9MOLU|nr:hypothetical protein [Spiroplasma poulsonii]KAF0850786.1 hypothetical protein MSROBK_016780 [Spiroplasma poulsonii]KAF0851806.1 hypothetical protein MSROBK_004040 [Spiroplasma poulsonii]MBW1241868.1 hypothetical protein [Spiroplasma poulsonii]PQM30593.1 hypothetical protein SMSRO_SF003710 [Spiroplasma poulsonii]PQM31796.1 hypothetical protein SMSRO_SF016490 [Spiroplasma poulsonii]